MWRGCRRRRQSCWRLQGSADFPRTAVLQEGFQRNIEQPRGDPQEEQPGKRQKIGAVQQGVAFRPSDIACREQPHRHHDDADRSQRDDSDFDAPARPDTRQYASQADADHQGQHQIPGVLFAQAEHAFAEELDVGLRQGRQEKKAIPRAVRIRGL